MSLFDGNLGPCTSSVTEQLLLDGLHINAYEEARKARKQRIKTKQCIDVDLYLPKKIERCNGWFPVIYDGSFNIVKDLEGIVSRNGKIPQITSEEAKNLVFLTHNEVIKSGIDKYGGKTTTEVPYSEIIDSITKDRIIKICYKANRCGL